MHNDLQRRSTEIGEFLAAHRPLWTERAFTSVRLSWEAALPDLVAWLDRLSLEALDRFERQPARLIDEAPPPLTELAARAHELSVVPELCSEPPPPLDLRLKWRVRRRKQQQVAAFAACVAGAFPPEVQVVDWCAGKGHLGRLLVRQHGRRVLCIEQDPVLCADGRRLDARARASCSWLPADIHGERAREALAGSTAVALHACGELHRELVQRGAGHPGFEALALAPCCYHRETHALRSTRERPAWRLCLPPPPVAYRFTPLSSASRKRDLGLDENALRLATSDEVIARPRIVRRRQLNQIFRLGADELLRAVTGEDRHHSLPPFPARWLRDDFPAFVDRLADALQIELDRRDLDAVERRANARVRRIRALGLVRGVFRRPVEVWLALDTACYLQERGFDLRLGTFCDRAVTPRNLCLLATRDRPASARAAAPAAAPDRP